MIQFMSLKCIMFLYNQIPAHCSHVSGTVAQHSVIDYVDVVKVKKATDSIKAFVKDWDTTQQLLSGSPV